MFRGDFGARTRGSQFCCVGAGGQLLGLPGAGVLYNEVQYIMGNGHMGSPVNRQTDTSENITNSVGGR